MMLISVTVRPIMFPCLVGFEILSDFLWPASCDISTNFCQNGIAPCGGLHLLESDWQRLDLGYVETLTGLIVSESGMGRGSLDDLSALLCDFVGLNWIS